MSSPTAPSPLMSQCMRDQLQAVWDTMTPDQHIERVDKLLRQRRQRNMPVEVERRGRNPQRKGWESVDNETDCI